MGRPFSVFLMGLTAVLLLTGALCAGARREPAQEAFFSMIFPQLVPQWEWTAPQDCATPGEALPNDGQALGEAVCL